MNSNGCLARGSRYYFCDSRYCNYWPNAMNKARNFAGFVPIIVMGSGDLFRFFIFGDLAPSHGVGCVVGILLALFQ